jgi:hypothetical protein
METKKGGFIFMKEIKKIKKSPFFMATAAMFVLPIPTFLAYLVPLDVDVTGNNTAKICEVWSSEFNIFCTLVTMATAAILNLFNPQKLPHTTVDILTKFHEVCLFLSSNFIKIIIAGYSPNRN